MNNELFLGRMFRVQLFCLVAFACCNPCLSQIAEYRRVFVPADTPDLWPIGKSRYFPIPRQKFEDLIGKVRLQNTSLEQKVRIRNATYLASLETKGQLKGSATYHVELPGIAEQVLSLEPFNLTITSAHWKHDIPHGKIYDQDAKIGLWNWSPERNETGVLVQQSGQLLVEGSWYAQDKDLGKTKFLLKTPSVVPQIFNLKLPPEKTAIFSPGELLDAKLTPEGDKLWSFNLSPATAHQLTIASPTSTVLSKKLPRTSQSTSYHLETSGVTIVTQFVLEASSTESELRFSLPEETQIVSASVDQVASDWETLSGELNKSVLLLRRPPSSQPQQIEVKCFARLKTDGSWTLPRLRPLNVSWTEGTTSLLVAPELEVRSLVPTDAALQHIVGLTVESGEVYRLQEWSNHSFLVLDVVHRQSQLQVRMATAATWEPQYLSARTGLSLSGSGSGIFQVEAEIAAGWSLDSIETIPQGTLQEWHTYQKGDREILRIQLSRPLEAKDPLKLFVKANASKAEISNSVKVGQLKILRILQADVKRELLLLANRQGEQKELHDRLIAVGINKDDLPEEEAALLQDVTKGVLVDITGMDDTDTIQLRSHLSIYDADINISVSVMPDVTMHQYQIDCRPQTGSVSEIVVQSDKKFPETLDWEIPGVPGVVAVEEITHQGQFNSNARQHTAYTLRLPIALEKPFRLQAKYSIPSQESLPCNLLQLPEAALWQGQIELRGVSDQVGVLDSGWQPAIGSFVNKEEAGLPPILGCYHMNSEEPQRQAPGHQLTLVQLSPRDSLKTFSSALVAWRADYNSLQSPDGTVILVASFLLENAGAETAHFLIPEGAKLDEVWVHGKQYTPDEVLIDKRRCQFRINDPAAWQTLVIKYITQGPALGQSATIQLSLPECSFPVYLSRWTLWTPQQYVIDEDLAYPSQDHHWWSRLFGPLSRHSADRIFSPVRANDWKTLWSTPLDIKGTKRVAEQLAHEVAAHLSAQDTTTWGELLLYLSGQLQIETILKVDEIAATKLSVLPNSIPGIMSEQKGKQSANIMTDTQVSLLSRSGLAFIACRDAVVLTSQERVAHWRQELHATSTPGVYLAKTDGLNRIFFRNLERSGTSILPIGLWANSSLPENPPGDLMAQESLVDMSRNAWTVEFVNKPPSLTIYRAFVQRSLWYSVWLLAVVFGSFLFMYYRAGLMSLIFLSAAICLVIAPRWLDISQAVFLGMLSAVVFQIIWKKVLQKYSGGSLMRSPGPSIGMLLLTSILLSLPARQVYAQAVDMRDLQGGQEAQIDMRAEDKELPLVMIPIDAKGMVQGKDLFIDESFFKNLNGLASQNTHFGATAVILTAEYRGAIPRHTHVNLDQSKDLASWTLSLTVESFKDAGVLDLPLNFSQAKWLAGSHRLNGMPVKLRWQSKGNGCQVRLGHKGIHQLDVVFEPKILQQSQQSLLNMQIPPVPKSSIHLSVPSEIKDLQMAGMTEVSQSVRDGNLKVMIPSQKELKIGWTNSPEIQESSWSGNIEQLSWLHITSTNSRLDVQLLVDTSRTAPHSLVVQKSPYLKVLPPEVESPLVSITPLGNKNDTLLLVLKEDLGANLRIPLHFELQRSVSLGRVFFPSVKVVNNMPTRNLFAVSVASNLSYDESAHENLRSITPSEFSEAWDASEVRPLNAYSLEKQDPKWSLRLWPAPKTFSVQQTMKLHFQLKKVTLQYEASVDGITGNLLMHRMTIPSNFSLDSISLQTQQDKESIPMRWSREGKSKVVIFLGRPLSEPHLLTVYGTQKFEIPGEFHLPNIGLIGSERNLVRLNLYRTKEVLVHWADPEKVPQVVAQHNMTRVSSDILVGQFIWRTADLSKYGALRVVSNPNLFTVNSCIALTSKEASWKATLYALVQSQSGVLDQLRLTVPDNFQENFQLFPEGAGFVGEINESDSGRQITIFLSEPLREKQHMHFRLSGTLKIPVDRRLEFPDLNIIGAESSERFVLLPTQVDGEKANWQYKNGLHKLPLTEELRDLVGAQLDAESFQVVQETFFAKLRSQRSVFRNAAVRYAVLQGVVDRNGALTATVEMAVQPGSATHCTLWLPRQSQLLHLQVGDQDIYRKPTSDGGWTIPLGPAFVPRKVSIAYAVKLVDKISKSEFQIRPPTIVIKNKKLPCRKALWRIRWPGDSQVGNPRKGQKITASQFSNSLSDFRKLTIIDASSRLLELPFAEGQAWYSHWSRYLGNGTEHKTISGLNERFKTTNPNLAESVDKPIHRPVFPPILSALPNPVESYYRSNAEGKLVLPTRRSGFKNLWKWLATLLLVSIGIACLLRFQHIILWYRKLKKNLYGLTFAAGLFYWLLLRPSALGLLIMTVVIVSLAQREWHKWQYKRHQKTNAQMASRAS